MDESMLSKPMDFFTKSANGIDIYIDLENSHAATHIKNHPQLLDYARKIVESHEVIKDEDRFETDMGFTVGLSDLVTTSDKDEIVYAKRTNRDKINRFVKNRVPEETSTVTMDIRKGKDDKYFIYTVYIGKITPKSPGGEKEDPDSRDFWNKHALVWGSQDIEEGSETPICPW